MRVFTMQTEGFYETKLSNDGCSIRDSKSHCRCVRNTQQVQRLKLVYRIPICYSYNKHVVQFNSHPLVESNP